MATLAEELATIEIDLAATRSAIAALLSGAQSYTDNDGQTITYASLDDLRNLRRDLIDRKKEIEREINRQTRGRTSVAEF